MRTSLYLSLVVAFLSSLACAVEQERTADIFAWPFSASKPQSFVKVTYTSTNATIKSLNALSIPANEEVVRVGFHRSSGEWSGVATAASNIATAAHKRLQLHVTSDGELYHVGVQLADGMSQGKGLNTKDGISVEVVEILPGPAPYLNKPVVVNAEGKVDDKEPEKTFLQKYWWAIGLVFLLQVVMGGGGAKEAKE